MSTTSDVDIFLLGAGQSFPGHLTIEVLDILTCCKSIYTLLDADQIAQLPIEVSQKCQPVFGWYRDDRARTANYAVVVAAITKAARASPPVAWLTWGNPRVLDSVSQDLIDGAGQAGLSVVARAAISSIDTVLIDVGYDPANGVLVIEGTTAIRNKTPLIPSIATMIFQPGTFGSDDPHMTSESDPVDLAPLAQYIASYYASTRHIALVSSVVAGQGAPLINWVSIADLPRIDPIFLRSSSIYIPPMSEIP